jgi:hypothetical protein
MATSDPELLRSFEQRIADDKAAHLRGWARVHLFHLVFLDPIRQEDKKKDKKIITQLGGNIAADGCHDEKYPIPAIIDDSVLQAALNKAGIQSDSLIKAPINPPKLRFSKDTKLECLDGRHRQLAAKQVLPPAERWWTIEFYGKGKIAVSSKATH